MVRTLILVMIAAFFSCNAAGHDIKGLAHDEHQLLAGSSTSMSSEPQATSASTTLGAATKILTTAAGKGNGQIDHARLFGVIVRKWTWPTNSSLRVCFYDGSADARAAVANVATEWTRYGNVALDFGSKPSYRNCQPSDGVLIRVSFAESGYWSYIGKEAIPYAQKNEPTVGLEQLDQLDSSSDEFKDTVLHEFGHALGFHHEHQSPLATCEPQFDKEAIKRLYHWTDADIVTNFKQLQVSHVSSLGDTFFTGTDPQFGELDFTAYDSKSIMHYSLPANVFKQPPGSCYIPQNHGLSPQDKAIMRIAYPYKTNPEVQTTDNAMVRQLQRNLNNAAQMRALNVFLK